MKACVLLLITCSHSKYCLQDQPEKFVPTLRGCTETVHIYLKAVEHLYAHTVTTWKTEPCKSCRIYWCVRHDGLTLLHFWLFQINQLSLQKSFFFTKRCWIFKRKLLTLPQGQWHPQICKTVFDLTWYDWWHFRCSSQHL